MKIVGIIAGLLLLRVERTASGGYIVDGRFVVAPGAALPGLDGRFHACFPKPGEMRCFFAPKDGL